MAVKATSVYNDHSTIQPLLNAMTAWQGLSSQAHTVTTQDSDARQDAATAGACPAVTVLAKWQPFAKGPPLWADRYCRTSFTTNSSAHLPKRIDN